jgi:hypothetical protein
MSRMLLSLLCLAAQSLHAINLRDDRSFNQASLDNRRHGLVHRIYHLWLSSLDMDEMVRLDKPICYM